MGLLWVARQKFGIYGHGSLGVSGNVYFRHNFNKTLTGIGNDFAPSLKSLNEFKTKFAPETTQIAAGRDIPIKKAFYRMLRMMQSVRKALKPKPHGNAEKVRAKESAAK